MSQPAQPNRISRWWNWVRRSVGVSPHSTDFPSSDSQEDISGKAPLGLPDEAPVPLIWMLGKTGSGKSSIIQFITGADDAEIGNGFRPQTKHSRQFDFPSDQDALVRFLDTRGIGEADYQPDDDLERFGRDTDLVMITVRATDQSTDEIVSTARQIRSDNPARPVLLVITALHDGYPGQPHAEQDAFGNLESIEDTSVPDSLRRSIQAHQERFDGLYDRVVAVDLTKPEDGFDPADLGGDRLFEAILEMVPAAMRQTLATMDMVKVDLRNEHTRKADRLTLTYAAMAAGAAAVPTPWFDIPVVLAIQSHLAHRIARHHDQTLTPTAMAQLSTLVGVRSAIRLALGGLLRGATKAVPVLGSAINSAAAFAFVYASGKVFHWYFGQTAIGHVPSEQEVEQFYREQLDAGKAYWRSRREESAS